MAIPTQLSRRSFLKGAGLAAGASLLPATPSWASPDEERQRLARLFHYMGKRYGVDPLILMAIAEVESQRHLWTLNVDWEPFFLETKSAALATARTALARRWLLRSERQGEPHRSFWPTKPQAHRAARRLGLRSPTIRAITENNVDIGIMQISWRYHGDRVPGLSRLLDEDYNIAYGAWYLRRLAERHGMDAAIGVYHAGASPEREARRREYQAKVFAARARLLEEV